MVLGIVYSALLAVQGARAGQGMVGTVEDQRRLCRDTGTEQLYLYPFGITNIGVNITVVSDDDSVDVYDTTLLNRVCAFPKLALAHCQPGVGEHAWMPSWGQPSNDVRYGLWVERFCAPWRGLGTLVRQYIIPSAYDAIIIEFVLDPSQVLIQRLATKAEHNAEEVELLAQMASRVAQFVPRSLVSNNRYDQMRTCVATLYTGKTCVLTVPYEEGNGLLMVRPW